MVVMHVSKRLRATAVAAVAIAVMAGAAGAQDNTKPTPTNCAGLAFQDPAGDQRIPVGTAPTPQKTKDNMDIVGGFFRYANNAEDELVLTANLQIANLNKDLEQGANGAAWYF